MSKDTVMFEGENEVIVANSKSMDDIVKLWFLDGRRSLNDYDVYLLDGSKGFAFSSRIHLDTVEEDIDLTERLSTTLQKKLLEREGGW